MATDLDALEALLTAMTPRPWAAEYGPEDSEGRIVVMTIPDLVGVAALVNAASELIGMARALRQLARHVTLTAKHRDIGCTPQSCAKCEAQRILDSLS